ncbi:MAG: DUF2254 family protein [Eubacteriales bacterium]|nr:DUF2254 family protein [Eubacteriales bacterium]
MLERYKLFCYNHKTWIDSLQYVGYSIVLITLVTLVDLRILPIQDYIPSFMQTSVGLAKSILSTLAAALLTITTFTFSTILGVLTYYANAYSPRTIETFVKERITMKVLGIFIGGFFYSISALTFMRDNFEFDHVIAGFVAVIYSIISIVYFIIFVQKVIYSLQPVNLVSKLYEEGVAAIEEELERRAEAAKRFQAAPDWPAIEIRASQSGYLNVMNEEGLISALEDGGAWLTLTRRIGEYVPEHSCLARLQLDPKFFDCSKVEALKSEDEYIGKMGLPDEELQLEEGLESETEDEEKSKLEKLASDLSNCFFLQDNQVTAVDYRFAINKLVEVALRAISPGINDPSTAIHCIRKISLLLCKLAKSDHPKHSIASRENFHIDIDAYRIGEDLIDMFQPILHYGQADFMVMRALIEGLESIEHAACVSNKSEIEDFEDYVLAEVEEALPAQEFRWLKRYQARAERQQ